MVVLAANSAWVACSEVWQKPLVSVSAVMASVAPLVIEVQVGIIIYWLVALLVPPRQSQAMALAALSMFTSA